jgi:hypothetical protein
MYFFGDDVEKDRMIAADWFSKAAKDNNPEAQYYFFIFIRKLQNVAIY